MYETVHSDGRSKGRIEFTVWSQIFSCPECAGKVNFTDAALDSDTRRVREEFPCPHCGAELTKQRMERLFTAKADPATGSTIQTPKRAPSLISYKVGKTRYEKRPDANDLLVLERIEGMAEPREVPATAIPPMHMTHERARMDYAGITHIHHFYMPRSAQAMGHLWRRAIDWPEARIRAMLKFFVEQGIRNLSVLNALNRSHSHRTPAARRGISAFPANTRRFLLGISSPGS